MNRLEDFLLKPVIPFIRIGHLPRGRYFKLLGDLIMVSADVPETMNKILPIQQQLIAVALKRKITYSGHFIIEYIDKAKWCDEKFVKCDAFFENSLNLMSNPGDFL